VEAPAELLEVVGEHEEYAREHERDQGEGDRHGSRDSDRRGPVSDTTARTTSVRLERCVPNGLPCSSSRTCALMPTARKNAARTARSRPAYRCGASAAPIATLARFHAV